MSRSRKKNPFHWVCGTSAKEDKVKAHRDFRRAEKLAMRDGDEPPVSLNAVSGEWDMSGEGKMRSWTPEITIRK